jgi:outer membrane protein assembly factor BamE (lipoprotein component of BamABCDE complex)
MRGETMSKSVLLSTVLFLLLFMSACQQALYSQVELAPDVIAARQGYESSWLSSIEKQEVRRGMSTTDVYLSWGKPLHRFRAENREKWIYIEEDSADDQPRRITRLFFVDGNLAKWSVDRGFVDFMEDTGTSSVKDTAGQRPLEGGK